VRVVARHNKDHPMNWTSIRSLIIAGIALGIAPLAFAQEQHTKDTLDMVKKALAEKKAVLIDVREKSEWDDGHIKDAKLLPLSLLKDGAVPKGLDALLPKDKIAYLHCAAGRRCLTAADALRKAGYEVRALKDGYKNLLTNGFQKADDKEPQSIKVWPAKAPGEPKELPPEADISKPGQGLVAGKPVIRLGNVSTPMLAIYRPAKEIDTGAAVVICPGGGHTILAYDLEGTEVAEWLNKIGVTACVLKYRVPARDPKLRYQAAVQDAQRAMSVVRANATDWGIEAKRIGILGFSAGGEVAGLTALFTDRLYDVSDAIDKISSRPDFAILIYPAYFDNKGKLHEHVRVTKAAPPMFFAHAANDPVTALNSLLLATELKKVGVPAELHLYATGGHGFGLRPQADKPCTQWPTACEAWLRTMNFTSTKSKPVSTSSTQSSTKEMVDAIVAAGGGKEKLLKLFRMKDSLTLGESPTGKRQTRVGVVEAPSHWWQGGRDRVVDDKEPAISLIWTWTLGALVDEKSKLEILAEKKLDDRDCVGLKIAGSINPPLNAYFDKETKRLTQIDWRGSAHKFSDWRQVDGAWYAAKCSGYTLATGKAWYHTEIVEMERLSELPKGITRDKAAK